MTFKYACVAFLLSVVIVSIQAKHARHAKKSKIKNRDSSTTPPETLATTPGQVDGAGECSSLVLNNPEGQQNIPTVTIPQPKWTETPSIVKITDGHYRALGRFVHMQDLREQLVTQKHFNFATLTRDSMDLVQQLDVLADTVYIQNTVELSGIRNIKIHAREIVGSEGSKIVASVPNWDQQYATPTPQTGMNGENGNQGIDGPQVDILCDVINGVVDVTSNAGDGHTGQEGGTGPRASSRGHEQPPKTSGACRGQTNYCTCDNVRGTKGIKGQRGGTGGNAGTPGIGGSAGNVNIRYRELNGQVKIKSCKGTGAPPATNGVGGQGGAGGTGGVGRICDANYIDWVDDKPPAITRGPPGYKGSTEHTREKRRQQVRSRSGECPGHRDSTFYCTDERAGGANLRGQTGEDGDNGAPGSTPNTPGDDGSVSGPVVQSGTLDEESKQSYPVELLVIMRRQAEDRLLSNSNDPKGREALEFILSLAKEISGNEKVERIKKYVTRRLAFLGKAGYDIFGNNNLFAPRIKWEALEGTVEEVKDAAEKYEDAFNDIIATVQDTENFQEMGSKISEVSSRQVNAEKERLEQAKYIAETEKNLYIKGIKFEEEKMTSILESIDVTLGDAYTKVLFTKGDFFAVLQGVVGFSKAINGLNPADFIGTALGLANSLRGKKCLQKLTSYMDSIRKWLTFGEIYKPYEDSSQLDFDQLDVSSIPEIMQANLEMNKEEFTSELVCLLEVVSSPTSIAAFKAEVESFFIAGAARIDLIGKCLDLDNDLGGYMFDIPLLEETEQAITDVGNSQDAPLSTDLRQNFLDYLLSTYRTLERSFMRNLYELHKAFVFRTLWEGNNPLASFQRVATESAFGTGRLNGAVELTEVQQNMKRIQDKAVKCFTNNIYATGIKRWNFNANRNQQLFDQLAQGYTRFSLLIDQSCEKCYNLRLLKIYIELYGDEAQPTDVPATVHLQVRHLGASYFRAGEGIIFPKQFRQPLGSYRNIEFDRFTVTKTRKCQESKENGQYSSYCLNKEDSRWHPMCNNQLTKGGGSNQDRLLGMEECKSPFGIYELKIPVDENLECGDNKITNTNCKDLKLTKFTRMNVWTQFFYWTDQYPTGPDDGRCKIPLN